MNLPAIRKGLLSIDSSTRQGRILVDALESYARLIGPDRKAFDRLLVFFTAQIENDNTREAYGRAARDFFRWCDATSVGPLIDIDAVHIAAYIKILGKHKAPPTVKQHLAALRHLFDWLAAGGILPANPASPVRGPKYSQKKGKTPVFLADDARQLIDSIPTDTVVGLRDRAIIALMTYTFARVSAGVEAMEVGDVFSKHHRLWIRLHEKGGKEHEMPCHHNLEVYLREYIEAAGIAGEKKSPLFRSSGRGRSQTLTRRALTRRESLAMIKRRVKAAGIENAERYGNHSMRGTGITAYLTNPDARLEHAQQMAGHSDPKTTRMYDRRSDEVSLDEVEKIGI